MDQSAGEMRDMRRRLSGPITPIVANDVVTSTTYAENPRAMRVRWASAFVWLVDGVTTRKRVGDSGVMVPSHSMPPAPLRKSV